MIRKGFESIQGTEKKLIQRTVLNNNAE